MSSRPNDKHKFIVVPLCNQMGTVDPQENRVGFFTFPTDQNIRNAYRKSEEFPSKFLRGVTASLLGKKHPPLDRSQFPEKSKGTGVFILY